MNKDNIRNGLLYLEERGRTELVDSYINEILNGTRDLLQFNQPEHAGVCSAGPLLIGALIVCDFARESLSTSGNVAGGQGSCPSNWQIDRLSSRLHLEDMHPANVFVEQSSDTPVCIDCIVKFRRDL